MDDSLKGHQVAMEYETARHLGYIRDTFKTIQELLSGTGSWHVLIFKNELDLKQLLQSTSQCCNDKLPDPTQSPKEDARGVIATGSPEVDFLEVFAEAFPEVENLRKDGQQHQQAKKERSPTCHNIKVGKITRFIWKKSYRG